MCTSCCLKSGSSTQEIVYKAKHSPLIIIQLLSSYHQLTHVLASILACKLLFKWYIVLKVFQILLNQQGNLGLFARYTYSSQNKVRWSLLEKILQDIWVTYENFIMLHWHPSELGQLTGQVYWLDLNAFICWLNNRITLSCNTYCEIFTPSQPEFIHNLKIMLCYYVIML